VTILTALVPRVPPADRFTITRERSDVWRVLIRSGFMEHLSIEDLLPALKQGGCEINLNRVVYYVGHETIARAPRGQRLLGTFGEGVFLALERNQAHLTDVLGLPSDHVIEIGRHVEL